jgi:hypothetical protein
MPDVNLPAVQLPNLGSMMSTQEPQQALAQLSEVCHIAAVFGICPVLQLQ